ncbi:heat shock protein 70 family [Paraphysoderma sedebokerense]|nr:heat shock protein 70 family [Paraphysoderma sedebokerense]
MSVVGIDFGNLQTCIAVARNRGIDVIVNEVSNRFTPSLVGFGAKQRYLGEAAKTQELSNLKNTVGCLKRLVGRPITDPTLAHEQQFLNVKLVKATNNECGIEIDYLGKPTVFSATQLTAMYLGRIRDTTADAVGIPVSDCVISIPGWFSEAQKRAMIDAAEIAGLNPLRVMNDGTSAALAYGITKTDLPPPETPRHVVFVDIGHSNSSVTVAAFYKGGLTVKGAAYDAFFGGRDFDKLLVDSCCDEFKSKYNLDIASHPKALFRLYAAVEKAKKVLSANQQAPLNIEAIMNDRDVSTVLQRSEFESMIAPMLDRIVPLIERAITDAGLTKDQINFIETVGGTTRIPIVRETINKYFGKDIMTFTLNQDEAVARGCALQCAMISPVFKVREFAINDITPWPIKLTWTPSPNVMDEGDNSIQVFPKHAPVPCTKILTFYRRDTSFDIEAHYDETLPPATQQSWLGRYTVKKIPIEPDAKDPATVKVKVKLNLNGLLSLESASLVKEEMVPIPEKEEKADSKMSTPPSESAEANGAPAPEGAQPMETDESKEEEKPETPTEEKKPKFKKVIKKTDLSVVQGIVCMDKSELGKLRETENSMHATDKLVFDTEVAKNALEEYVYDIRSKIEDSHGPYMEESIKPKFFEMLTQAEDWLYSDEGEDATKSVYVAKLDELKKIGGPVAERYLESQERPRAERMFRETVGNLLTTVSSNDPKYSHIPTVELQSIAQKATEKQQWLENTIEKQNNLPKYAPLVITVSQINKEREDLERFSNGILSKPKPAPPKEEKKEEKKEDKMETDKKDAKTEEHEEIVKKDSDTMEVD